MNIKLTTKITFFFSLISTLSGCSITTGNYGINSHFAYPNSNIVPLGHVKASTSKIGIVIPPDFDGEDIILLTQEAIRQRSGADLLINYNLDTKITSFPFISKMEITIEGTAAKMEVGSKELKSLYENIQYKAK